MHHNIPLTCQPINIILVTVLQKSSFKKKTEEKKKSNLEMFKEELKRYVVNRRVSQTFFIAC